MGPGPAVLVRLVISEQLERGVRSLPAEERLAWRVASRYVAGRGGRGPWRPLITPGPSRPAFRSGTP